MLFSINILFVIPKITAIETIDDPPKLNKGNGKPVTGIKPTTVDTVSYTHLTLPTRLPV